jgi:hypothetical protein
LDSGWAFSKGWTDKFFKRNQVKINEWIAKKGASRAKDFSTKNKKITEADVLKGRKFPQKANSRLHSKE